MSIKYLHLKKAVLPVLLILLLSAVGMTNAMAQTFTQGNLNYSINSDGATVTVTGHVDGTSATGELVIPESVELYGTTYPVTVIGYEAFYNCSGLTGSLVIPNSVTTIGQRAFCYCTGINGTMTLGDAVRDIGYAAFYYCNFTGTLTVPESVTSIDGNAFYHCYGFTSLNYNAINCSYVNSSWLNNTSLTTVTIGENVQVIPENFLYNRTTIAGELVIPESVTSIGGYAFYGCTGFGGSLVIPELVTTIGYDAFNGCSGFNGSLTIGNSVTSIGENAFNGCSGFTGSLTIPNSVNSIGVNAFSGCTGFSGTLTLGGLVAEIGNTAFFGACQGFTSFVLLPEVPPTLGNNVFVSADYGLPVSVPCGSLDAYQNASGWNVFTNLQEFNPCLWAITANANPASGGTVSGTGTYEQGNTCTLVANPNENFSFVNWTEDGVVVSTDAEYAFTVTENRHLMANFIIDNLIGEGTATNSYLPCYSYYPYSLTQQIYTAEEIGQMGVINWVAFYNAGSQKTRNFDFYLVHTEKSSFSSSNDWVAVTNADKVFSGNVNMVSNDWTIIYFDTPFAYNGTTNVILVVDDNTGDWNSGLACRVFNATSQAIRIYGDGTNYNPSSPSGYNGSIMSVKNQVALGFSSVDAAVFATISPEGAGSVSGEGVYPLGGTCTLTATTSSNDYVFVNWTENGEVVSTNAQYSFTVTGNRNLVANFLQFRVDITASANPEEGGTVTGSGNYLLGQTCTLTATPNEDYAFVNWTEDGVEVSTNAVYTFAVVSSRNLVANFRNIRHGIWVEVQPENGGIVSASESGRSLGELYYDFEDGLQGWTVIDANNDGYTWCLTRDIPTTWSYYASMTLDWYHSGTNAVCSGSYINNVGALHPDEYLVSPRMIITAGSQLSFWVAAADVNYAADHFGVFISNNGTNGWTMVQEWTLTSKSTGKSGDSRTTRDGNGLRIGNWYNYTVDLNAYVGPKYIAFRHFNCYDQYIMCLDDIDISNIMIEDPIGSYLEGETCTLTATPNDGYVFYQWMEDGGVVSTDAVYSFTVMTDRTLTARFKTANPIVFADPNVEAICVNNWDTDGDGFLSYSEAAAVTDLGSVFRNNSGISSFNELQYFTGLTTIGYRAFYNCYYLNSVTLPSSVTSIDSYAFYNSGLSGTFAVPNAVTSIGTYAFANCYGLTSVNISGSISYLNDCVFYNCYNLSSISLPTSLTSIGSSAFYNCSALSSLTMPNSVTYIYDNAFEGCISLASVGFSTSLYSIGYRAFYGCSGLTGTLDLPNSVNSIGEEAFMDCTALSGLNLSQNLGSIGTGAFRNCSGIRGEITLPASLWSVGEYAFYGCDGISTVNYNATNCSSFGSASNPVFYDCAFPHLNIGANVQSIPDYAFKHCFMITDMNVAAANPPTIYASTFGMVPRSIPVTVPMGSGDAYRSAQYWEEFFNIIEGNMNNMQISPLAEGWNWWSSYVELTDNDGLSQLENSIGSAGMIIKSRTNGYVEAYQYNGETYWYGTLGSINNEQMYKIRTNAACNAIIAGDLASPSNHPITINSGWNWIGFPYNQNVSVDVALSGFTPANNDIIKGRNGYTTYYSDANYSMWYGTLNTLESGKGYMYRSNSSTSKTLTFQTGRGEAANENITTENNHYRPNGDSYADNMTITAVLELNGEELRSDEYELAAFVGDECRGSVRLMYVEPIDRYIAFLMVYGEQSETLSFRLTDGTQSGMSSDDMSYVVDGVTGTMTAPVTLRFETLSVDQNEALDVVVYPNPSEGVFNIQGQDIRKIEVFNAYGQVVVSKEIKNDCLQIDLSPYANGVYMLRLITDKGMAKKQIIKH